MQRALDSAIGLPSRSTSASWMLVLLMPPEVRRNLMLPPGVTTAGESFLGLYGSVRGRDWRTTENSSAPTRSSLTFSGDIPERGAARSGARPSATRDARRLVELSPAGVKLNADGSMDGARCVANHET